VPFKLTALLSRLLRLLFGGNQKKIKKLKMVQEVLEVENNFYIVRLKPNLNERRYLF
jgi:hypothetical protein